MYKWLVCRPFWQIALMRGVSMAIFLVNLGDLAATSGEAHGFAFVFTLLALVFYSTLVEISGAQHFIRTYIANRQGRFRFNILTSWKNGKIIRIDWFDISDDKE